MKFIKELQIDPITISNYRSLFELGQITHSIFDKTNTLTSGKIEVIGITTRLFMYDINLGKMENVLSQVRVNPEIFLVNEEKEFSEDSEYSEKSQEFEKEKDGDYIKNVFEEDTSMTQELNKMTNRKDYDLLLSNSSRM